MFDILFHYPALAATSMARWRNSEISSSTIAPALVTRCKPCRIWPAYFSPMAEQIAASGNTKIGSEDIEAAGDPLGSSSTRPSPNSRSRYCRQRFVQTATDWLRFLARLQPTPPKPAAFADLVDEFARLYAP